MSSKEPPHSSEPTGQKRQKISITAVRQMILSTAIMALVLISLTEAFVIMRSSQKIGKAQETRYYSYLLSDELRQSSDDLTRMVRTYSQTAEKRYVDYYQAILDIRNGKSPRPEKYHGIYWDFVASTGKEPRPSGAPVALRELMNRAGFTETEFHLLEMAENESNSLVNLEVEAINAMEGLYKDASGAYTVQGKPNPQLARQLLHGQEYHEAKERIMYPLEKFLESIDSRTIKEVKRLESQESTLIILLITTTGLSALLAIVSIIIMADSATKL